LDEPVGRFGAVHQRRAARHRRLDYLEGQGGALTTAPTQ
jgi:hypothetical protein